MLSRLAETCFIKFGTFEIKCLILTCATLLNLIALNLSSHLPHMKMSLLYDYQMKLRITNMNFR